MQFLFKLLATLRDFFWLLFTIIYPLSMANFQFLPLLIGFVGLVLMHSLYRGHFWLGLGSVLYFFLLEISLSLPIGVGLIATLLVYFLLYEITRVIRSCYWCVNLILIVVVDLFYYSLLYFYQYVNSGSDLVNLDILYRSLLTDLAMAVLVP